MEFPREREKKKEEEEEEALNPIKLSLSITFKSFGSFGYFSLVAFSSPSVRVHNNNFCAFCIWFFF